MLHKNYEQLKFISNILIGYKNNKLYILNTEKDEILYILNEIDFNIDRISDIRTVNDQIHINALTLNNEQVYIIYDTKTSTQAKISGLYDEIKLINNKIYAFTLTDVSIYDLNVNLIKENSLNLNSYNKREIISNYILSNKNDNLTLLNLDTFEETILLNDIKNM